MENIFEIRLTYSQDARDIITYFSNKQGGSYNVFSYHWQCYVWAAIIGFLRNDRRKIDKPYHDKPFSMQTMRNNGGEKDAQALICLAIAKAGSLDVMKNPHEAINLINEYANGGFAYIKKLMENGENTFNDLEKVKQEIFSRDYKNISLATDPSPVNNEVTKIDSEPLVEEVSQNETVEDVPEYEAPKYAKVRSHWTTSEIRDLKQYYKDGLKIEQLSRYFGRNEQEVVRQLVKYGLITNNED